MIARLSLIDAREDVGVVELTARSGDVTLAGSLWTPTGPAEALVVMHPGSGASDRHNDVLFPPIRAAFLAAGVAVASFDKRGVGGSGGSWLDAGIEEQARDLLAGLAAAAEHVTGVPRGAFGHSQGGWVVLDALRRTAGVGLDFGVTSSGPAVTVGDQERYSSRRTIEASELDDASRQRAIAAADAFLGLGEAGASYHELLGWLEDSTHVSDLAHVLDGEIPGEEFWGLLVRLAAYDPRPAPGEVVVPLLAVFGAADDVTPVEASVDALRARVDPGLLEVAVLPGGGHRMAPPGSTAFVAGYPDVVVDFVLRIARSARR